MYIVKQHNTVYILEDNYPRSIYTGRIWQKYPDLYIYYKPQIIVCIQDVQYNGLVTCQETTNVIR